MALLPVSEVFDRLLGDVEKLPAEDVPLAEADNRVLATALNGRRTQPPFDASAMDGYAVRAQDTDDPNTPLEIMGESAAGHRFNGRIETGQAVRILTGAPVPEGADTVLIQENTRRLGDREIVATEPAALGRNIRKAGLDFAEGDALLPAGRLLDAGALSLAAAANHPSLSVVRRPRVAIIATGDELVLPGSVPGPDQIIASNSYGVAAIARKAGATILDFGVVADDREKIAAVVAEARQTADVIVTLGGASVGDHDLVRPVLEAQGMRLDFWKIAMRPGKPLMFGRLGETRVLGLPGNPVASLVCSHLFLAPLVAKLGGRKHVADIRNAILTAPLRENDQRQDYIRASSEQRPDQLTVTPFGLQDSSMLNTLARADCLIIRPPFAPAADGGELVQIMMIR
ncbi:molybdopterin molybdotransferase MoeA [Tianweitania sp. BSSL-BM11]|uniref:Molybdopterin molybdenumtransferase n=1 Tax=Tianweitania aestuarii TaxID=2814886 RepID=A0ABS5RVW5_9HYPH|nr:gephyrin-like molybdotransferase Glp [Tianweitania aestuarii]MBS9720437.1 molybdopterin molybdotransferase MoeA [Tianweitania aestuarii]